MEVLVVLIVAVGLAALAVFVIRNIEPITYPPPPLPLDEQGPIHVLDQVALERTGGFSNRPLDSLPDWTRGVSSMVVQRAYELKRLHPDWYLPQEITEQEWRKAIIFVRLVDVMVDILSVEPESVRRDSRLVQDLGAW